MSELHTAETLETPPVRHDDLQDGDQAYLSLSAIDIQQGHNPRRYFDDAALRELVESIQAQGIIQPVVVRPNPDSDGRFLLVAGERRIRAAQHIGLDEVPAVIRMVGEREAFLIATSENTKRDNMSAAEEAEAARNVLDANEGDKEEAARKLGWSPSKLDARLLLLHADQAVLDALTKRQIKLGHAELLSSLPVETQVGTLKSVIEKNVPVSELRKRLEHFSLKLSKAVFDTAGCRGCPHNTTDQASLFADNIGEGRCTNVECWNSKVTGHVEDRRKALADEYPVVWLDTEKSPDAYTYLIERGNDGVGPEQYRACQGCQQYGAILSTRPGEIGHVRQGVCFNLTCNKEKVKAYQNAIQPKPVSAPATSGETAPSVTKTPTKKPRVNETPKAVQEKVVGFHKLVACWQTFNNPRMVLAMALNAMLKELSPMGSLPEGLSQALKDAGIDPHPSQSTVDVVPIKLYALESQALQDLIRKAGADLARLHEARARAVIRATDADLTEFPIIDQAFLEAHTKGGLSALLTEAGFDMWLDNNKGKGSFRKLMSGKKPDLIKAVLDSGYDFKGFVPNCAKLKKQDSPPQS